MDDNNPDEPQRQLYPHIKEGSYNLPHVDGNDVKPCSFPTKTLPTSEEEEDETEIGGPILPQQVPPVRQEPLSERQQHSNEMGRYTSYLDFTKVKLRSIPADTLPTSEEDEDETEVDDHPTPLQQAPDERQRPIPADNPPTSEEDVDETEVDDHPTPLQQSPHERQDEPQRQLYPHIKEGSYNLPHVDGNDVKPTLPTSEEEEDETEIGGPILPQQVPPVRQHSIPADAPPTSEEDEDETEVDDHPTPLQQAPAERQEPLSETQRYINEMGSYISYLDFTKVKPRSIPADTPPTSEEDVYETEVDDHPSPLQQSPHERQDIVDYRHSSLTIAQSHNIPAGTHLIEVSAIGLLFSPVRVDISARKPGKVQAALTETRKSLVELVLEPLREEQYYEIKEPLDFIAMMIGFVVLVMFLMPKLVENMDPEEIKRNQEEMMSQGVPSLASFLPGAARS